MRHVTGPEQVHEAAGPSAPERSPVPEPCSSGRATSSRQSVPAPPRPPGHDSSSASPRFHCPRQIRMSPGSRDSAVLVRRSVSEARVVRTTCGTRGDARPQLILRCCRARPNAQSHEPVLQRRQRAERPRLRVHAPACRVQLELRCRAVDRGTGSDLRRPLADRRGEDRIYGVGSRPTRTRSNLPSLPTRAMTASLNPLQVRRLQRHQDRGRGTHACSAPQRSARGR